MYRLVLSALVGLLTFPLAIGEEVEKLVISVDTDLLDVKLTERDQSYASFLVEKLDKDGKSGLSVKESMELKLLADKDNFDFNENEILTDLELGIYFANVRKQLEISAADEYNAGIVVSQFDRNGDKALSKEELKASWIDVDFEDVEVHTDGFLTRFEFARHYAMQFEEHLIDAKSQRLAMQYVKKYDKDSDHRLNRDEASGAAWPQDPFGYDENLDGLSSTEIARALSDYKVEVGVIQRDEMRAEWEMKRLDRDRNMRISPEEAELGKWSEDWGVFDRDGDGALHIYEFTIGYANVRRELGVTESHIVSANSIMKRYDRNRNGTIDSSEILGDRAKVGLLDYAQAIQFDRDKNQRLTAMEIAAFLASEE